MSKPEFEQFLNDSLNHKQDISPDKDLWPGVERAIATIVIHMFSYGANVRFATCSLSLANKLHISNQRFKEI